MSDPFTAQVAVNDPRYEESRTDLVADYFYSPHSQTGGCRASTVLK